jgi:hypothetical protein
MALRPAANAPAATILVVIFVLPRVNDGNPTNGLRPFLSQATTHRFRR